MSFLTDPRYLSRNRPCIHHSVPPPSLPAGWPSLSLDQWKSESDQRVPRATSRSVKKPARTKLPKVSRTPTSCEWWRRARSVIQKHHIEQLEFYPWKLDVICKGTLTFCIYSGKCKWHSLRQWSKSSVRRSAFQIRGVLKYCSIEGTHATRIYPQVSNRNQALQIKSKLRK